MSARRGRRSSSTSSARRPWRPTARRVRSTSSACGTPCARTHVWIETKAQVAEGRQPAPRPADVASWSRPATPTTSSAASPWRARGVVIEDDDVVWDVCVNIFERYNGRYSEELQAVRRGDGQEPRGRPARRRPGPLLGPPQARAARDGAGREHGRLPWGDRTTRRASRWRGPPRPSPSSIRSLVRPRAPGRARRAGRRHSAAARSPSSPCWPEGGLGSGAAASDGSSRTAPPRRPGTSPASPARSRSSAPPAPSGSRSHLRRDAPDSPDGLLTSLASSSPTMLLDGSLATPDAGEWIRTHVCD